MNGYARCVTEGCERFQDDRLIDVRVETVQERAPEMADMVLSQTEYVVPVEDEDLTCPSCGMPCALTTGKAKVYARMAPG